MPYARPTLLQLRDLALQQITAALITNATGNFITGLLPKSVLRVVAYVLAGFTYLHYQFLDWISKQSVPFTSEDEYLAGWGALKGVTQEDATYAGGAVTFPCGPTASVPSGSAITRGDGVAFVSTFPALANGNVAVVVPVIAVLPGSAANTDLNVPVTLAAPVANVIATGSVSTPIVGGADQETQDSYRVRVLAAFSSPAQGGDPEDYIEWASAVPGVSRAWVAPRLAGAGSVTVFIMLDVAEATNGGFPLGSNGTAENEARGMVVATGDQLTVANAIYPKRGATALVYVNAPNPTPIPFTISNLGTNNNPVMQAVITRALASMLVRFANVGGSVNPITGAPWPPLDPSAWYAALAAIPGLSAFSIPSPNAPLTPPTAGLFTVGPIQWQS